MEYIHEQRPARYLTAGNVFYWKGRHEMIVSKRHFWHDNRGMVLLVLAGRYSPMEIDSDNVVGVVTGADVDEKEQLK